MSAEQIENIIKQVLERGLTPELWVYVLIGGVVFLSGFAGSYMGQKGKNYATKEDFDEILDQLKETTKITEEIKAQISKEEWLEKKKWEYKQGIYAELISLLHSLQLEMSSLSYLIENDQEEKTWVGTIF